MLLADAIRAAGLPEGVVNIVPAGREVGEHLVRHPRRRQDQRSPAAPPPAGGSPSICGEQLKRVTLELGGKSAAIILDDADLSQTVGAASCPAALMNNGQACVAQTRDPRVARRYRRGRSTRVVAAVRALDRSAIRWTRRRSVGPLVAARQRDRVEGYIAPAAKEGAQHRVRRRPAAGAADGGWYVEPTVFVDVDNRMRIAREEIFGPVLAVIPVRRRGRRAAHRERLGLRSLRLGVDRRRRPRPRRRAPRAHRHLHGERLRDGVQRAVRRLQVLGSSAASSDPKGSRRTSRLKTDQPADGLRDPRVNGRGRGSRRPGSTSARRSPRLDREALPTRGGRSA